MIKFKRLYPDSKPPLKATKGAGGYDLYSYLDPLLRENGIIIEPQQVKYINTGIAIEIPEGYVGIIKGRSGLAKFSIDVFAGVIDSDYRGEVKVAIYNGGREPLNIRHLERIAQLLVLPLADIGLKEVSELSNTERGIKGFGSTGMK